MTREPTCEIREAVFDDAGPIAELLSEMGYPTSSTQMRERLERVAEAMFRTFVAQVGTAVVGVAGVGLAPFYEHDGTYARLLVLCVREQYHRKGLGKALVRRAEAWAAHQGAAAMVVNSGNHRTEAHAFYAAAGYDATGQRFMKDLRTM